MKKKWDFYTVMLYAVYVMIGAFLLVGAYFACRVYVADQFIIPSDSMCPTLIPGDRVIVNKLIAGARIYDEFDFGDEKPLVCHRTRGWRKVEHNDIVIFNFPINYGKKRIAFKINYVYGKRCIGLPGDSVCIVNGFFGNNHYSGTLGLYAEQQALSVTPDSVIPPVIWHVFPFDRKLYRWTIKDFGPLYVPKKGDTVGLNSRNYILYRLPVEYETGKRISCSEGGKLKLGHEPIESYTFEQDYYFLCGDNVSNSNDSRYWGFVPEDFIVGVVSRITYSRDKTSGDYRWSRFMKSVLKL